MITHIVFESFALRSGERCEDENQKSIYCWAPFSWRRIFGACIQLYACRARQQGIIEVINFITDFVTWSREWKLRLFVIWSHFPTSSVQRVRRRFSRLIFFSVLPRIPFQVADIDQSHRIDLLNFQLEYKILDSISGVILREMKKVSRYARSWK